MLVVRITARLVVFSLLLLFTWANICAAQEQTGSAPHPGKPMEADSVPHQKDRKTERGQGALTVEDIELVGLQRTRPIVVTRYLTFHKDSPISPEIIEENYQRLVATNFFKEVIFSTRPGSARGRVIVVIEVRERVWPVLEFAGGFTELDGWYLSPIGIRAYNLFGSGQSLGLRMIIGDRVGGFNLRWQYPEIFASGINFQLDLDALGRDIIHYFDGREVLHRHGIGTLSLSFSGNSGFGRYLSAGYRGGSVEPESFAKFTDNDSAFVAFPSIIQKNLAKKNFASFWASLHADTRDNPVFPRRGFWGALSVESADPEFGGELQFTRWIFDARFFEGSPSTPVAALRLKAAKTSDSTPYYERFYLGGANSLRGFAERGLTPVGWGTELLLGSFEIRVPLSRRPAGAFRLGGTPPVSAAFFIESGAIGTPEQPINRRSFHHAAGFGARVKIPLLGPLRLDFAYPLDEKKDFQFHLSLGQTF